eukprot:gene30122-36389_t
MEGEKTDSDYGVLESFFAKLQLAMQERDVFGSGKSLLFSTDKWNWCFDASKKYTLHHWHNSEKAPIHCDTTITTNSATLRALATGSLKPMHAFMSGRVKFSGDRGVLKVYAKAMKQAMVTEKKTMDSKLDASAHLLDARIVDTSTDKGRDKEVVKYVILVVNKRVQQSWKVCRRYSDFIKLQHALQKSNQPVKAIKSNSTMFASKDKVVKERVGVLNEFLHHITHNLPAHNTLMTSFLTNDQHSNYLWQHPQDESTTELAESTPQEDISNHMSEHSLPYEADHLARNAAILNEMSDMKQNVDRLKKMTVRDEASFVVSLLSVGRHILCAYLAFCCFGGEFSDNNREYVHVTWHDVKSHFYTSCFVVYLLYSKSFPLLAAYWHLLCIPSLVRGIVSAEASSPSLSIVLKLCSAYVDRVWTSAASALQHMVSLFFMHNRIDLAYILLCTIYVVLIAIGICFRTNPRLQRGLEIYSMGLSLIAFYASLSLTLYVLRFDEQRRTVVYNAVDPSVATYVTHQIKHYKSIFIKFAQYFGARSDVMSTVWSEKLSVLQDQCSESRGSYAKQCVQDMLRDLFGDVKVEDVFHQFDFSPVASASIAQVHFGLLNLKRLKDLQCKDNDVDWTKHLRYLEVICQSSSNNAEFSSCNKSKDSNNHFLPVAVKIQHEDIDTIMTADMEAVLNLTILAAKIDSRWQSMVKAMRNWKKNMVAELDFTQEASNLQLMHDALLDSQLECIVPQLVFPQSMQTSRVLVMSRIFGYKVTDKLAIA